MNEQAGDKAEFGKSIARLIWQFTDIEVRNHYREERRDFMKRICKIRNFPLMTYAEYLNKNV